MGDKTFAKAKVVLEEAWPQRGFIAIQAGRPSRQRC